MNEIIGKSLWARDIGRLIARVAPCNCTVLIEGPTGTGKELIARAIHARSRRCDGPLVVVDCASVSATLFASELFGHVKGAYSGADGDTQGSFRAAGGGTIFLDEIGELPPGIQGQLLRVIQGHAVTPVGDHRSISVDVRIVAATNRDLEREVGEGRFREDLSYRLNVAKLTTVPLSRRAEDIPLLGHFFLGHWSAENGAPARRLSADAVKVLMAHDWPGNVRQLQNVLERAAIFGDGEEISAEQVRAALGIDGGPAIAARIGIFDEDISSVLGVDASAVPVLRPGGPPGLPAALGSSRRAIAGQAARLSAGERGPRWPSASSAGFVRPWSEWITTQARPRRLGVDRRLLVRKARKYGLLPMRRHLRAA